MEWRLEIDSATIFRLIRKKVFQRGYLDLRVERDHKTGEWIIRNSGWKPLDALRADHPSMLLRGVALVLDGEEDKLLAARQPELEPPSE